MNSSTKRLLRRVGMAAATAAWQAYRSRQNQAEKPRAAQGATAAPTTARQPAAQSSAAQSSAAQSSAAAPSGAGISFEYAPRPDGRPDPGEIIWTWVAYEDDPRQGKDRPVLLIGRDGEQLFGLQLTSKDHDLDRAQEASAGRYWMDIGTGPWDAQGRPSEVRLNRLLKVDPHAVRREGAVLDRAVFEAVVTAARPHLH